MDKIGGLFNVNLIAATGCRVRIISAIPVWVADDNESVPDSQQDSGQLKTAVRGSGSMNMWWLGLLGLLGAVRHFVLRRRRAAAMMVAGGLSVLPVTPVTAAETCGAEGYDIKSCWYVGAGVGAAHLNPEGRVNGWGTDSAGSLGVEVHLGQYITPKWFWELRYTDAGEAELGNVNPALDEAISDAAISYKIPSIMAGYVVWSGAVDVYVKAGMSFIETKSTDSRIGQDEQSSTQLAMGAMCSTACRNCPGRCICH